MPDSDAHIDQPPPGSEWPGGLPPPYCRYSKALDCWVCDGPPPPPWPDFHGDELGEIYGPIGTLWFWDEDAQAGLERSAGQKLLARLLRKLGGEVPLPQDATFYGWHVATLDHYQPPGDPVDFVRTQIIQAVGPTEQAVHVLQWIPIGSDAPAMDTAALKAHGDRVRDSFKTFLSAPVPNGGGGNGSFRQMMATEATYIDVHTSLVHQAAPGAVQRQVGQTAISPFGADSNSLSDSGSLPYEVALCLSLNTNFRGTRFRGRTYLGPLANRIMGSAGLFNPTIVDGIGAAYGAMIDRVNQAGDLKLSVISHKYATAAPVQGVRVGQVPDSQRRRRRGQQENFLQVWGTPIGGAA